MEKLIAYCGLRCDQCPAYEITLADDDARRAKLAVEWSREFKADIKPEHINCLGCTADTDVHFPHWHECPLRRCAQERDLATCAHCPDYSCDNLEQFFGFVPTAKETLDTVRKEIEGS
ncbi:MAG: DUF3795 domain-containing protein [Candidatus Cloacimonetes bacterium]|nr:DUF3795 domain-containing protein [Candidatus Cloacimonadota bacterium]